MAGEWQQLYDKHMHACMHVDFSCFFVKYLLYYIYINYRRTEVPNNGQGIIVDDMYLLS